MCDQTELSYLPDDVVWVKLGPVWWPGRVCKDEEIPPEIMKDLRKTPIAIVKFFQEDSFEYVKKLSNIYHYNCLRKNEFIKKGLDMLRLKNRDAPSNMKLFPEDIVRAEFLTGGNPAILQDDMFLPEEKSTYADLFTTNKKTPKKVKPEMKKKTPSMKQNTPRLITHPRFLQLSSGHITDYEVRERKQEPVRFESDKEDITPPPIYRCTDCEYTTTRLNVIVWHNKSHTRKYASPQAANKATKRKSTTSVKLKERLSIGANNVSHVEYRVDDVESGSAAKIPKTNGTLKVRTPKMPGRKKSSTVKSVTPKVPPITKETNSSPTAGSRNSPMQKSKRMSVPKSDEFQKSLLEDWLEDEMEQDAGCVDKQHAADEKSLSVETAHENTTCTPRNSSATTSKDKSCFDFDDSEDHLIIDKSKFKLGRKIPRLLDDAKSGKETAAIATSLEPDDVVPIHKSSDLMEIDVTTSSSTSSKHHGGVEDGVTTIEPFLSEVHSQTSQLQEMGVENEIEINTEETLTDELPLIESAPSAVKNRRSKKTEVKAEDATQLCNKVDQLLDEISKTPPKLPEIPRSHKKAHLKAYCESLAYQQAEAEEQAARKAAAEEKAAVQKKAVAKEEEEEEEEEAAQQKATSEEQGAQQKATSDMQSALTIDPAHENLHPETMNIEVSSIPLPSPQKRPVTSESVESSINVRGGTAAIVLAKAETQAAPQSQCSVNEETLVVDQAAKADDQTLVVDDTKPTDDTLIVENAATCDVSSTPLPSLSAFSTANEGEGAHDVVLQSEATSTSATAAAAATGSRAPVKFTTTPKLKQINAGQFIRSGQRTFKIINPTDENYKSLINKITASTGSAGQLSPNKNATFKGTLKTPGGKSIVCNLTSTQSQKVLLANSQSTGSPTKIILLNCKKPPPAAPAPASATVSAVAVTSPSALLAPVASGRTIDSASSTAVRLTPNILQKTAAQKATAALAKSTGKNIVLDASTFQTLLQSHQQMCKPASSSSQILLPDTIGECTSQAAASLGSSMTATTAVLPEMVSSQSGIVYAADDGGVQTATSNSCRNIGSSCANNVSSSTAGQTVEFNYIVDSSGYLVQVSGDSGNIVDAAAMAPTKDKDILAKALENTDGLQTEMALTDATNSVLDSCSVVQNTEMAYKTEAVFENLTLSTPPIMSAYEKPSRAVARGGAAMPESSNEMMMMMRSGSESSTEYIT